MKIAGALVFRLAWAAVAEAQSAITWTQGVMSDEANPFPWRSQWWGARLDCPPSSDDADKQEDKKSSSYSVAVFWNPKSGLLTDVIELLRFSQGEALNSTLTYAGLGTYNGKRVWVEGFARDNRPQGGEALGIRVRHSPRGEIIFERSGIAPPGEDWVNETSCR